MVWFLFSQLVAFLIDLSTVRTLPAPEKDLQILLLRQQVRILQRTHARRIRMTRVEKTFLAVLTTRLKSVASLTVERLREALLIVRPKTVLQWHQALVRRKWMFHHAAKPGHPALADSLQQLIIQMVPENPGWGYLRISGELLKVGYSVDPITVRNVLKRHRVPPAPERRHSGVSWQQFLNHYRHQLLDCDFFTVETLWLKTVYILFFIELGTRRVHLAGCTASPHTAWVVQQTRQQIWKHGNESLEIRFLIHDRDTKFSRRFDSVFVSEGIEVIRTPFRTPQANAVAERWVWSVREECLDQLLILNQTHLNRVLREYTGYYNAARAHQGWAQQTPIPLDRRRSGTIHRRDILGGILHDYHRKSV